MKRLIMINLLLVFLLNILPVEATVGKKQTVETLQTAEVTAEITSRSLSEPRQERFVADNETITDEEIVIEQARMENKATNISQDGINLIKKYEGLKLNSYKLEGETNYTIGYGTSNPSIKEGQKITVEEAERLLMEEVQKVTVQVLNHCDYLDLTQSQLDGLISFTYNVGYSNLKKLTGNGTRTIEEIAEHITAYTKSKSEKNRKGLEVRRNEEKQFIINDL